MPLDIAINVNDRRIRYAPGAGTFTMDFDFPIFEKSHLRVTLVRGAVVSTLTLDVDYTIPDADLDTEDGGTITLAIASLAGDVYILDGNIPNERLSDYQQLGVIPARQLNDDLDLLWMRAQEMTTRLDRSIAFKNTFNGTPGEIDDVAIAAGAMIRRNSANDGWEFFTSFGSVGAVTLPLSIANGGTGQTTAALAWNAIKQMADQATVDAGADDSKAFSPLKLWTTPMRGGWKNVVGANGGLEVWQRGAGGSASLAVPASTTSYTADRWYLATGVNQAHTVSQQAGLVAASRSCARVQRNAGQTGVGPLFFGYPLDSDEINALRGRKLSLRLLVRAGANWSPASGTLSIFVQTGTGALAKRSLGAFTGAVSVLQGDVGLTPGGGAATVTIPLSAAAVGASVTQCELFFFWTPTGTAGAADYFEVDDIDIRCDEPVIDQFERRPFEDELRACMRHFQKTFSYSVAPAQGVGETGSLGWRTTATGAVVTASPIIFLPVRTRIDTPTVTLFNPSAANSQIRNVTDGTDFTGSAGSAESGQVFSAAGTATAGTAVNELCRVHATIDGGI